MAATLASFGFFLFAVYMCVFENRRAEARKDHREDLKYYRTLNDMREFGFEAVQRASIASKSYFRFFK